jgi:hypothetical protein
MYALTLTYSERKAIDWISNRYRHGTDLYELLWLSDCTLVYKEIDFAVIDSSFTFPTNYELQWDDNIDITFNIPEHTAWEINDIIQENDYALECFCDELRIKLIRFSEQII